MRRPLSHTRGQPSAQKSSIDENSLGSLDLASGKGFSTLHSAKGALAAESPGAAQSLQRRSMPSREPSLARHSMPATTHGGGSTWGSRRGDFDKAMAAAAGGAPPGLSPLAMPRRPFAHRRQASIPESPPSPIPESPEAGSPFGSPRHEALPAPLPALPPLTLSDGVIEVQHTAPPPPGEPQPPAEAVVAVQQAATHADGAISTSVGMVALRTDASGHGTTTTATTLTATVSPVQNRRNGGGNGGAGSGGDAGMEIGITVEDVTMDFKQRQPGPGQPVFEGVVTAVTADGTANGVGNGAPAGANVARQSFEAEKKPAPPSDDGSGSGAAARRMGVCGMRMGCGRFLLRSAAARRRHQHEARRQRVAATRDVRKFFWFSRPELLLKVQRSSCTVALA